MLNPVQSGVMLLITIGLLLFGLGRSFLEFRRAASVGRGWSWLLISWKFDLLQLVTLAATVPATLIIYRLFPAILGNSIATVSVMVVLVGCAWVVMGRLEAARDRARDNIIAKGRR